jgi:tRNA threonylcarbamoyladenosine biosynthesis protein TsaE
MIEIKLITNSSDETEQLAYSIGGRLKGGEIIELSSDLGGGKTTFTRGLAAGMGSSDIVSSPTFTISKVYSSDKLKLHHFDFYRLPDAGLMEFELSDALTETSVTVVEWGEVVKHVLPNTRLRVALARLGDNSREINISCPSEIAYLLEDL